MVRKLLKYDLKALLRIWIILSITALGLSVVAGFGFRIIMGTVNSPQDAIITLFAFCAVYISILGLAAYNIVMMILQLVRYYQHFYTDQGYLTFTLPVKRSELFLSKMLTAVIYNFASFLVTLISIIIVMAIAPANVYGEGVMLVEAFKMIGNALEIIFTSGLSGAIFILALIAALIHGIAFSPMVIYTAVTIGCVLVKKLKVLASLGIYYASTIIMSIITSILTWGANMILVNMGGLSSAYDTYAVLLMVIIVMMMLTVGTVLLYRFNLSRIEKNLNLA